MMQSQGGVGATTALRELKVPLKPGSVDPYFTDDIGNVSTSRYRPNTLRDASLELKPRYPVFGGWKYSFRIGWNNALSSFVRKLKSQSDTYILAVPLLEGPRMPEGIQYEQLRFRIILPEGSSNINYELSQGGETAMPRGGWEVGLHKSFMDTLGRTELVFSTTNVVDDVRDQGVMVYVTYTYGLGAALRKPVSIVAGMLGVFVVVWALGTVDVGIGKGGKKV